jgi:hypothetical protein
MKRIIYKNPDNSVSIIVPSDNALKIMSIEDIAKKDVPTGLKYKIVDVSEVLSDREFRNAWTIDEAELTDGVGACFIKAQEQSLDTISIVADKQTLRDLPSQVDTANSIEEIKAVWNDLLGDKE